MAVRKKKKKALVKGTPDADALKSALDKRFGGVLKAGYHRPDGEACLLEADHVLRGDLWSDTPEHLPDLRWVNDGYGRNNQRRTESLLPVWAALWNWKKWGVARQRRFLESVLWRMLREQVAPLLKKRGNTAHAERLLAAESLQGACEVVRAAAARLEILDSAWPLDRVISMKALPPAEYISPISFTTYAVTGDGNSNRLDQLCQIMVEEAPKSSRS